MNLLAWLRMSRPYSVMSPLLDGLLSLSKDCAQQKGPFGISFTVATMGSTFQDRPRSKQLVSDVVFYSHIPWWVFTFYVMLEIFYFFDSISLISYIFIGRHLSSPAFCPGRGTTNNVVYAADTTKTKRKFKLSQRQSSRRIFLEHLDWTTQLLSWSWRPSQPWVLFCGSCYLAELISTPNTNFYSHFISFSHYNSEFSLKFQRLVWDYYGTEFLQGVHIYMNQ